MGVSIFFIIVRGIEFGDLKTQQWLTSIVTGFFSSILLMEPMKVIGLAVFFACFCRNWNDVGEENEFLEDERIQFEDDQKLFLLKNSSYIYRSSKGIDRLNQGELAFARQQREKEVQMWSIIHEFVIYVIFITLICLITFSNRGENHFYQVKHLRSYFLNTRQIDQDFTKVRKSSFEFTSSMFFV